LAHFDGWVTVTLWSRKADDRREPAYRLRTLHSRQMTNTALETVLRRDRLVVAGALAVIAALGWGYLLWLAANMDVGGMDMIGFRMIPAGIGIMAPADAPWRTIEFAFVFAMWAVMMIGMMAPSAAPMILMYARVGRQATAAGKPLAATGWFAAGYLAISSTVPRGVHAIMASLAFISAPASLAFPSEAVSPR